ncbi:MAG: DUF1343 domain-containing protein [Armatimonadetes bacterium]|nr:DUF1343 domain-containing protein [Armatimonadota bacterium]
MIDLAPALELVSETAKSGAMSGAAVVAGRPPQSMTFGARFDTRAQPALQIVSPFTLFDMASLTKPLVTAALAAKLIQAGDLKLDAPIRNYLSAFTGGGRDEATIRDLLTHSSGLPAWKNYLASPPTAARSRRERLQAVVADICATPLVARPGEKFIYSDLGFILLGAIIENITQLSLSRAAARDVFGPSGMKSACFKPKRCLREQCAPTITADGEVLQGVVHDENARYLGGIAGHAGLFAAPADVASFCTMLLAGGLQEGRRVLSPAAIAAMTTPQARHPGQARGLGWDIDSDYAVQVRGKVFPPRGFGHTGYTGTSVWIDPPSGTWVAVLAFGVRPTKESREALARLRRGVADVVARQVLGRGAKRRRVSVKQRPVVTGLEVEESRGWPSLRGKRVGVLTNNSAIDSRRRHLLDLLRAHPQITLVRLFAPEHGLEATLDQPFGDGADPRTGLPVISLYGKKQAPSPEDLADLDAIVFDVQDAGVRFYTYTATLVLTMRAAAAAGVEVVVLDRPGLLRADMVDGPLLDRPFSSLAEYHPLPVVHGLTVGELARYANQEYSIHARLTVVPCENYRRHMWFEDTLRPWVNPSPNLRSPKAAILYPAIGMLERCNVSVGRGTEEPFEVFGAPWVDGGQLARELNNIGPHGLKFEAVEFTPATREFQGQQCQGCRVLLEDRDAYRPVVAGLQIALSLERLWPGQLNLSALGGLLGDRAAVEMLGAGTPAEVVATRWKASLEAYLARRETYLLY